MSGLVCCESQNLTSFPYLNLLTSFFSFNYLCWFVPCFYSLKVESHILLLKTHGGSSAGDTGCKKVELRKLFNKECQVNPCDDRR